MRVFAVSACRPLAMRQVGVVAIDCIFIQYLPGFPLNTPIACDKTADGQKKHLR